MSGGPSTSTTHVDDSACTGGGSAPAGSRARRASSAHGRAWARSAERHAARRRRFGRDESRGRAPSHSRAQAASRATTPARALSAARAAARPDARAGRSPRRAAARLQPLAAGEAARLGRVRGRPRLSPEWGARSCGGALRVALGQAVGDFQLDRIGGSQGRARWLRQTRRPSHRTPNSATRPTRHSPNTTGHDHRARARPDQQNSRPTPPASPSPAARSRAPGRSRAHPRQAACRSRRTLRVDIPVLSYPADLDARGRLAPSSA